MKYEVGDRVRIKSLDWYNNNKDEDGYIDLRLCSQSHHSLHPDMSVFCGKIVTIASISEYKHAYGIKEDNGGFYWTDEMIECKVEEETKPEPKFKVGEIVYSTTWQRDVIILDILPDGFYKVGDIHLGWFRTDESGLRKEKITLPIDSQLKKPFKQEIPLPEGYQFVDENDNVINTNKIVLEKKKKEYPKTYEECCKVLGCKADYFFTDFSHKGCDVEISDYEDKIDDLLQNFRKLRYCRDAYWKLYGEEMGLGKPWTPQDTNTFSIFYDRLTCEIEKQDGYCGANSTLEFPTEEMRDVFYENFKEEIEQCKELL